MDESTQESVVVPAREMSTEALYALRNAIEQSGGPDEIGAAALARWHEVYDELHHRNVAV